MLLDQKDVRAQSENAWNTWKYKWLKNCAINKDLNRISLKTLVNECRDHILIQAAFGHSLSLHLDTIKAYRGKVKVMCCDKAYGYLMDAGIVPDYCIIADASVTTDWQNGHDTSETTLFANIACNPEWTKEWKGRLVFYVNWDNIGTADRLAKAGNCYEAIPASSNVSNAQVVLASQVLNPTAQFLVGYDYSWEEGGNYYAAKDSEKRHYMHHSDVISFDGKLTQTSSNLMFSCYWLMQFLAKFSDRGVVNCSERGILGINRRMPFKDALMKATGRA